MTYDDLKWALKIFDIDIPMSYKKIKARHKQLMKQYHPDVSELPKDIAIKKSAEVNKAYEFLKLYCEDYKINFSKEEFYNQNPEARLKEMYANDSMWGKPV